MRMQVWLLKRKGKKGNRYAVQWIDPRTGQRRTESVGSDKAYANMKVAERSKALETGLFRDITPIDYDSFVTEHLRVIEGILADKTCTETELALRQFKQACQPKDLTVIDYQMLERFRKSRLVAGVAPATVNKALRTLQGVLEQAVKRNYIKVNPFAGNRKALFVPEPEPVPRILKSADFQSLLGACPDDRWKGIITIGYYAGLRRGEILSLEWSDIDFETDTLRVSNKQDHRTKSRKNRTVPMTLQVRSALQRLRPSMLKSSLVFTTPDGHKMGSNFSRRYNRIVAKAGLVDTKGNPLFTLHDLRRTCATELLRRGVPPKTVQKILGHANLTTTMTYYCGVEEKDMRDAMKRLEGITA